MKFLNAINDLGRHTQPLSAAIQVKINSVVESGWFVLGKEVEAFEKAFSQYCGSSFCISVANGTDALELALRALNLTEGKQVATVANAGMYSSVAILAAGAQPVFIDIDDSSMTMSSQSLEAKLETEQIDGLIVTHLYGQLADVEALVALARARNIPIIEDCAQAHGASARGRKAGSFGDIGCFSFYPTKNLGALGDGGALTTSSDKIFVSLKKLRQYGWDKKYHVSRLGGRNSRLDEIQAAVLNIKLPLLDGWNSQRRAIVKSLASQCPDLKTIRLPRIFDESYVGHLLVVRSEKRDQLQSFLQEKGIATDIHYPIPDHRQACFSDKYENLHLPVTEKVTGEILTVPCFPEMTNEEVSYIAHQFQEFEKCSL